MCTRPRVVIRWSPAPIKRSSPSEEHSRYKRKPRPRDRDFNGPGCTAEDYAKLTGSSCPSMYHLEPLCTPLICQRLHVPSTVKGQVDHTISRRCAAESIHPHGAPRLHTAYLTGCPGSIWKPEMLDDGACKPEINR